MRYTHIGITGQKGSGKDTLAGIAIKEFGGIRWAFADKLKKQCGRIFGLTHEQMYDPKLKESRIATIAMDDYLAYMQVETGLDIKPHGIIVETPRGVLQFYGTEYVRDAQDSYWVDALNEVDYIRQGPVWITDMRFQNEVDKVQSFDGLTIRVVRPGQSSTDLHASEVAIQALMVDEQVRNDGELEEFQAAVTQLLLDLGFATNDSGARLPW